MRTYVALTDSEWYEFLSANNFQGSANFWIPGTRSFAALRAGERLLFKLHSPSDYIAGGGTYLRFERNSISTAWTKYGIGNGARTLDDLRMRIHGMRSRWHHPEDPEIGCIILTHLFFLPKDKWIPAYDYGWKREIVSGKTYDCTFGQGLALWTTLQRNPITATE